MHDHDWPRAQSLAAQQPDAIAQKLVTFARLLTPGAATAPEIAAFLAANPIWPDAALLRHRLADAIAAEPDPLHDCRAYAPPQDTALIACAVAERADGHADRANDLAQRAWITGLRDQDAEAVFLHDWPNAATPDANWRRFDAMAWSRDPGAARQIPHLDPGHAAAATARLAFAHGDTVALDALAAIPEALRADPTLLLEQARWLRATNAQAAALATWRAAVAGAEARAAPDRRPAYWLERDRLARAILATGDASGAYVLADDGNAGADQAPDALFLAGWIALQRLHDPVRALAKFQALQALSHSLITQSRAWYWIGRASALDAAHNAYAHATANPTTYYGQLAIAQAQGEAGIAPAIRAATDPAIPADQATTFAATDMVRAATTLVAWDDPHWARQFLLRQAQGANDPASFALVARTALRLGLPDVAVQTARLAGRQGVMLPRTGWPAPFEPPAGADGPLELGLMRQESSFDAGITSGAGAIGLMQLMPGTARQIGGAGVSTQDLKDPAENMRLGTLYFEGLLTQFGGVRAYAIAAYNAGPHRARAWIDANGDPGNANPAAMIDWIEQIPFAETRNYVQRVLENTAIYAARAP
jgi:soluble lytic murein transglycosylase